jgi:hypothetical protein
VTSKHSRYPPDHEWVVPRRQGTLWTWILAVVGAISVRNRPRPMIQGLRTSPATSKRLVGATTRKSRTVTLSGTDGTAHLITSDPAAHA